jgi:hypothetical protein
MKPPSMHPTKQHGNCTISRRTKRKEKGKKKGKTNGV